MTKIESFIVRPEMGIAGLIATLKRAQRIADTHIEAETISTAYSAIVHVTTAPSDDPVLVVDLCEDTLTDGSKVYSVRLT